MQADAFDAFQPAASEREALLEAQLSAVREQLRSRDAEVAELKERLGELLSHVYPMCLSTVG